MEPGPTNAKGVEASMEKMSASWWWTTTIGTILTLVNAAAAGPALPAEEPTSAEMETLVKRRLDEVAEVSRHATASCGRASASVSDPAAALICLGGALMGPSSLAGAMRITHFEKMGCKPASGAPGVVCDYRASVSSGPGRIRGPEVTAIIGPGGVARARFLKTQGVWVAFFQDGG